MKHVLVLLLNLLAQLIVAALLPVVAIANAIASYQIDKDRRKR